MVLATDAKVRGESHSKTGAKLSVAATIVGHMLEFIPLRDLNRLTDPVEKEAVYLDPVAISSSKTVMEPRSSP